MLNPSCRRIVWVSFSKLCTIFIPAKLLSFTVRPTAWREKVALFISYILVSCLFCFWLEFITALFCDPPKTFDFETVFANDSSLSTINGQVVDWHNYGNLSEMTFQVSQYPAMDLSPMFPLFMQLKRPPNQQYYNNYIVNNCIQRFNRSTQADNWLQYILSKDPGYSYENDQLVSCPIPGKRNTTGAPCFYSLIDQHEFDRYPKKGAIKYEPELIRTNFSSLPYKGSPSSAYVILDNSVLDVTDYLLAVTNIVKVAKGAHSRSFALDRMFLPLDLTIMLFTNMGNDITPYFQEMNYDDQCKQCLEQLFFHGVVAGDEQDEGCARINLALWITMGAFLMYFLLKINLANLTRLPFMQRFLFKSSTTTLSDRYLPPFTLLFIPCYAEPSEIIKQTFDSLARTNYPDTRKLLFFVCDGLATSRSDGKETSLCILESLGYSSTKDPQLRSYVSLGQGSRRINYAKVYAGFYESGRNRVPFLMIVKVGSLSESTTTRAPGNRGKRDSMLIVLGFLERCMNLSHNRITPLEFELFNQCYNLLGIDPRCLKYMLVTDADTQVKDDVVVRLVSRLEADPKLLAVNGHIRPANPEENIITMLQIFPIYLTFYSGLAYEACLGSVTTINGGFIMYKLWSEQTVDPSHLPMNQLNRWPKTSDEIQETSSWRKEDDTSSDDDLTATASSRNMNSSRRRMFTKTKKSTPSTIQHVSLAPDHDVQPICIQSTVLRGFAAPRPNTMHMENVLLLGEDQYFGIVLLRSHPQQRIGFEPAAIAYATIPTNFFALQALQLRAIRSTFHNLVEFHHVAKHLGFKYWITSLTKLLDMILSMPIIIYLYGVYIRYFIDEYQVYATIAGAFTGLIILHVFYFVIRRQFKYVFWFLIYGLFSVPIFNVYFPLLAMWRSDDGHRWYDVWPTKKGYQSRLHGIVADHDELEPEQDVVRMRIGDFEIIEAQKQAQREKEQVEMLDAKFNGFTGYVGSHASKSSWSSAIDFISSPPLAQTRDGYTSVKMKGRHSRLASEDDARFLSSPNRSSVQSVNSSPRNPFASVLDDPFDDVYGEVHFNKLPGQHKPSRSQSSYFSRTSGDYQDMFAPPISENTSMMSSSHHRMRSTSALVNKPYYDDSNSIISLTNSVISLEHDAPSPPPEQHIRGRRRLQHQPQDEGRSAPVHSRIVLQQQQHP